jgi:hypothetical protein
MTFNLSVTLSLSKGDQLPQVMFRQAQHDKSCFSLPSPMHELGTLKKPLNIINPSHQKPLMISTAFGTGGSEPETAELKSCKLS